MALHPGYLSVESRSRYYFRRVEGCSIVRFDEGDTLITNINESTQLKKNAVCIIESITLPVMQKLEVLRTDFRDFASRHNHLEDQHNTGFQEQAMVDAFDAVRMDGAYEYHEWKNTYVSLKAFGSKKDVDASRELFYEESKRPARLSYCRITPYVCQCFCKSRRC